MSFVEKILPYERELFLWLNDRHTEYWDNYIYLYSGKAIWLPLAAVAFFVYVYKIKWKEAVLVLACAVLVGLLCDYISAELIKPYFERLRPTHHPDFAALVETVNGHKGGKYGFISNHAANGFGIAVFSSLLFKNRYYTLTLLLWALTTAYSRIYLGVHFISDVAGGAIWGSAAGLLVYYVYLTSRRRILKEPEEELKTPVYSAVRSYIIAGTIWLTILFIFIYSAF
ncbi:MAG: phosphatase PAP2 family protein [Prevotella sp.]|jgi:undecaprenyl-diphosphatase|nr:phosphatase PAP2 family protein [Prevotella sp.]